MGFAEQFKFHRKKRGWTQQDAADHIGVSRSAVANYEAGKKIPRKEILIKIANVFGVSIDELLREGEDDLYSRNEINVDNVDRAFELIRNKIGEMQKDEAEKYALEESKKLLLLLLNRSEITSTSHIHPLLAHIEAIIQELEKTK